MSNKPLTDGINALTTYANEITGASDTTLSDAVYTLASGYGGGTDDYMAKNLMDTLKTYSSNDVTIIRGNAFRDSKIERVTCPNCASIGIYAFRGSKLKRIYAEDFPLVETVPIWFVGASDVDIIVLPKAKTFEIACFQNLGKLTSVDIGKNDITRAVISGSSFRGNPLLNLIILRYGSVIELNALTALQDTPFYNGGSGGTIYVPSNLINSYKSATNWSTYDGYGTITWKAIEGSIYETQYADGTTIV